MIINIVQAKISPILNCDIEFLDCYKGDVIVVDVPKRKDIHHAYMKKTTVSYFLGLYCINQQFMLNISKE